MSSTDKPVTMPDKPMVENGPAMPDKVFDLLRQAAQLLPSRFRDAPFPWVDYTYPHSWQVFMRGDWEAIWIQEDEVEWSPLWDLFLEAACREEIIARGWGYNLYDHGKGITPVAEIIIPPYGEPVASTGDTPAHALLAALLSAVEAQA